MVNTSEKLIFAIEYFSYDLVTSNKEPLNVWRKLSKLVIFVNYVFFSWQFKDDSFQTEKKIFKQTYQISPGSCASLF